MDLQPCDHIYVDGRWQVPAKSAQPIPVFSPVSEERIGSIAAASADDVDAAVDAARRAFIHFPQTSPAERAALLRSILSLMEERFEELALAISHEMGSAIAFPARRRFRSVSRMCAPP